MADIIGDPQMQPTVVILSSNPCFTSLNNTNRVFCAVEEWGVGCGSIMSIFCAVEESGEGCGSAVSILVLLKNGGGYGSVVSIDIIPH